MNTCNTSDNALAIDWKERFMTRHLQGAKSELQQYITGLRYVDMPYDINESQIQILDKDFENLFTYTNDYYLITVDKEGENYGLWNKGYSKTIIRLIPRWVDNQFIGTIEELLYHIHVSGIMQNGEGNSYILLDLLVDALHEIKHLAETRMIYIGGSQVNR